MVAGPVDQPVDEVQDAQGQLFLDALVGTWVNHLVNRTLATSKDTRRGREIKAGTPSKRPVEKITGTGNRSRRSARRNLGWLQYHQHLLFCCARYLVPNVGLRML